MEKEVRKSFIEYSMSVIVSRALPDVRDGMKPGQRRILYAMYEDKLTHDKPFRKSATTVGNVLGRYHPHGDAAVYGTMVRMAQPFSLRYTLVEGHGNFGNVDGDGAAAYRYTEARMSRLADEMMRDIDREVIDWTRNFDNTRDEPTVLPSRFPNLLVNGAVGIAVGMATNIPPHNMGEVIDGAIHLMDHPDATVPDLMQFVKGPDFPTGATVYGTAGIFEAYMTGHSRVTVRAKAEIDEEKRRIIITEIPYQVNKSALIESMADQVREKKIEGVTEIRDESGRATGGKELRGPDGMRIVIEYRRDQSGQVILNQFYKYTQLQDTCPINMLALVRGEPKVLNLKQILSEYVKFQEEVVTRRIRFDLAKAKREAHIYEGYKIAVDNIEEVIRIIRASADVSDAKINLQNRFGLDEEQSAAIVAMTLGRLSGLERQKIEEHLAELYKTIEELEAILADESKLRDIIRDELTEIKNRFSDDRRTDLVEAADDIVYEDLIEREDCVVTLTRAGYIKRLPADTYSAQNRGGKGVIGMTTKEDDFIERIQVVHSHATLLFFTSHGRVFVKKAYTIPEAGRTAKGTNIVNLLDIEPGESVTAMITVDGFSEEEALVMVTRRGIIKRTPLSEYEAHRKGGKIALTLDEGDELIFVAPTDGTKDIFIATRNAQAVRFAESKVRLMGRTAGGVIGVKLIGDDEVIGAAILERDEGWNKKFSLLTITEKGFGKRMECGLFEPKGRAIQGVTCHHLSDKTGPLCGVAIVTEEDDLMMITESGSVIRTPASGIPAYGRTAGGVIVMRLGEGDRICNVTVAQQKEEDETVEVEG
ncbi:MAG: DNA gyrase subunit A [Clostridia bacterium]|nr:DNA gyrase subunit A [Clostridia bacterium]